MDSRTQFEQEYARERYVYVDAYATTPPVPDVFNAMMPWLFNGCGNATSGHTRGRAAREAVESARRQASGPIGAKAGEVVFTSGGAKADHLAIFDGVPGADLLAALDAEGLALSGGAACHASSCSPFHVLRAMGLPLQRAAASIRFSLSKMTTANAVKFAISQVAATLHRLRRQHDSLRSRPLTTVSQRI